MKVTLYCCFIEYIRIKSKPAGLSKSSYSECFTQFIFEIVRVGLIPEHIFAVYITEIWFLNQEEENTLRKGEEKVKIILNLK